MLLALLFLLVTMVGTSIFLSVFTRHNREISVPDFTGKTLSEAEALASKIGARLVVKDSVYVRNLPKGVVCDQFPASGSLVKEGRKIELITNTVTVKKIPMPALVGYSLRQARAELIRNGLKLGRMSFVPDIAPGMVLKQTLKGIDVSPGTMVVSGSDINLLVSSGEGNEGRTRVPNVLGKSYMRAVDLIQDEFLNVGRLHFDSSVRTYSDTLNSFVYSQYPRQGSDFVNMGTDVVLSLSIDNGKRTF